MKISLSVPIENLVTSHGYGQASFQIVQSLQRLGHSVPYQDATAPVEINFSQPYNWRWSDKKHNAYRIGYAAWESSGIPRMWKVCLRDYDELWATSPMVKKWLEDAGYPVAQVYEHGIDASVWKRRRRARRDYDPAIRFLHIGEPAPRKGGQITLDAFLDVFGDNPEKAKLTIKAQGHSGVVTSNHKKPDIFKSVKVILDDYTDEQMVDLVRRHDVLVYPSYGEGFGLIPLQAMVTGMPVICTGAWAPYRKLLLPELRINSRPVDSPWPQLHPGTMFAPDPVDLRDIMLSVEANFEDLSDKAYATSFAVQKAYDWDKTTAKAFSHIVEKFDS